ncbi:MAG: sarcosine oxidase subunit alpha family protein [Pseudomonadota bacterium]
MHINDKYRINTGLTDCTKPVTFQFNDQTYHGYQGDTLASALLGNGVRLVGRSFKYHRPRGIFSAHSFEPNALVTLHHNTPYQEPNMRATNVEIYNGLKSFSQNHLGDLKKDMLAVNDFLSPFLPAGFYYKTFMWPKNFWEKIYEPIIRKAAGLGELSSKTDPSSYEKGYLHCDLLIIGSGIAGLYTALKASLSGIRIILCEEDFIFGGSLSNLNEKIDDIDGQLWVQKTIRKLKAMPNVRLMKRCTVFGCFDHSIYGALERVSDHMPCQNIKPRQHMWRIYTKHAVLASGASERTLGFANNDRPGIMLSSAIASYAIRFGVKTGHEISIFTNNDSGWHVAKLLENHALTIKALIDCRKNVNPLQLKAPVYLDSYVVDSRGRHALSAIKLNHGQWIDCDCLGVSGGWNPNLHLTCHMRGKPKWDEKILSFIPDFDDMPANLSVIGAATGCFSTQSIIDQSDEETDLILSSLSNKKAPYKKPQAHHQAYHISPYWYDQNAPSKTFIDQQNDVTLKDIYLSVQEGFSKVEHAKRYTTLGMATDQGKNSNIIGIAALTEATGRAIPEVGTTIYRPPYTPVSIAALTGRTKALHYRPYRLTPTHQWAIEQNAVFVESGQWLRAQWFCQKGEKTWRESVDREVIATRKSLGVCDVSTLGKIDIKGKDSAKLLDIVYVNNFSSLPIGKVRYGLMLREDATVMDDGTTARLDEHHYLMTTTTANASSVFRHLEYIRQCLYPNLDVTIQSVSDQFAQFAIAGPNARKLLQSIVRDDLSNDGFPFMACATVTLKNGLSARLFRISFSGELAYEIAIEARFGDSLIRCLMSEGKIYDICPYGTEALGVMRVEKGHLVANELNGQTSIHHLGMDQMLSLKKDFIGRIASQRQGLVDKNGIRLVGFIPLNPKNNLYAGAHLFNLNHPIDTPHDQGWLSSKVYSPMLKHDIALGFVKAGRERMDEIIWAVSPLHNNHRVKVKIVSPHFFDPQGERLNA